MIGLDGVFKLNKYRFVTWVIVCANNGMPGIPAFICISSKNRSDSATKFLQVVRKSVEEKSGKILATKGDDRSR